MNQYTNFQLILTIELDVFYTASKHDSSTPVAAASYSICTLVQQNTKYVEGNQHNRSSSAFTPNVDPCTSLEACNGIIQQWAIGFLMNPILLQRILFISLGQSLVYLQVIYALTKLVCLFLELLATAWSITRYICNFEPLLPLPMISVILTHAIMDFMGLGLYARLHPEMFDMTGNCLVVFRDSIPLLILDHNYGSITCRPAKNVSFSHQLLYQPSQPFLK